MTRDRLKGLMHGARAHTHIHNTHYRSSLQPVMDGLKTTTVMEGGGGKHEYFVQRLMDLCACVFSLFVDQIGMKNTVIKAYLHMYVSACFLYACVCVCVCVCGPPVFSYLLMLLERRGVIEAIILTV